MLTKLLRSRRQPLAATAARPPGPALSSEAFKGLFARQASTVSVITFYIGPHLHGFTATSVTPVSMTPPLALFCIASTNTSHRHLHAGDPIGISFLAVSQADVSARFAAKVEPGGYADIPVDERSPGIPLVKDAAAGVVATIRQLIPAGDHTIFLCGLGPLAVSSEEPPLLYHARGYHRIGAAAPLATEKAESSAAGTMPAGARLGGGIERDVR